MSRRGGASVAREGTPEEAEEFMALLIAAQKQDACECLFGRYFKKMGDRMLSQYVKEK